MDTALPQKFPFILDRNLAKANCTENHVCTFCDKVVLGQGVKKMCKNFMVIRHSTKELLAKSMVMRPMKCIVDKYILQKSTIYSSRILYI